MLFVSLLLYVCISYPDLTRLPHTYFYHPESQLIFRETYKLLKSH